MLPGPPPHRGGGGEGPPPSQDSSGTGNILGSPLESTIYIYGTDRFDEFNIAIAINYQYRQDHSTLTTMYLILIYIFLILTCFCKKGLHKYTDLQKYAYVTYQINQ